MRPPRMAGAAMVRANEGSRERKRLAPLVREGAKLAPSSAERPLRKTAWIAAPRQVKRSRGACTLGHGRRRLCTFFGGSCRASNDRLQATADGADVPKVFLKVDSRRTICKIHDPRSVRSRCPTCGRPVGTGCCTTALRTSDIGLERTPVVEYRIDRGILDAIIYQTFELAYARQAPVSMARKSLAVERGDELRKSIAQSEKGLPVVITAVGVLPLHIKPVLVSVIVPSPLPM